MIYSQAYEKFGKQHVTAGLIGSGQYSTALLGQSMYIPMLDISVIAENNPEAAKKAFKHAGIAEGRVVHCNSRFAALSALEKGKFVWVEDPMLMMDLPIDVIIEGTGEGETGAQFGLAVIQNGKHLAMLNKEADAIIGPYLKHLADVAGVVYTPVNGDQHGLLIDFVNWVHSLGLDLISASKSPDAELALDRENMRVTQARESLFMVEEKWRSITRDELDILTRMPEKPVDKFKTFAARQEIFKDIRVVRAQEVCETQIAANALGLEMDAVELLHPILRKTELPCVLCPEENGGIFHGKNRCEMISILRDVDDSNMGGGVFAIVSSQNEYARYILNNKGLHHNQDSSASLLPRPYHLCGVETSASILNAGSLGISSLYGSYLPIFDMYSKTLRPMKAGDKINSDDDIHMKALLMPAVAVKDGAPLHSYIYHGLKLKRDIPANTIITLDMVDVPSDSVLLKLRKEQDAYFGLR
jgi:predicted homoserine dehydrogenase-like protein